MKQSELHQIRSEACRKLFELLMSNYTQLEIKTTYRISKLRYKNIEYLTFDYKYGRYTLTKETITRKINRNRPVGMVLCDVLTLIRTKAENIEDIHDAFILKLAVTKPRKTVLA